MVSSPPPALGYNKLDLSEIRAMFFKDTQAGAPDWATVLDICYDHGFNVVIYEALGMYGAKYPSAVLGNGNPADSLGAGIAAAHARNMKFYVLMLNLFGENQPHTTTDYVAVDDNGNSWWYYYCATKPATRALTKALVEELVTTHPEIDGFLFDYIRWYDLSNHCHCQSCQAKFRTDTGLSDAIFPTDSKEGGKYRSQWWGWRQKPINELLSDSIGWMNAIRPGLDFGAAVFTAFQNQSNFSAKYYGQCPASWIKEGYMGSLSPMSYGKTIGHDPPTNDTIHDHITSSQNHFLGDAAYGAAKNMMFVSDGTAIKYWYWATSNGNVGGTTIIDTKFDPYFTRPDDYWNHSLILITSGAYSGQRRRVIDYDSATRTATVDATFGGQILSGVNYTIIRYYTLAEFQAIIAELRTHTVDGFAYYTYLDETDDYDQTPEYLDAVDWPQVFAIRNISVSIVGTDVTVSWETDVATTGGVEYSDTPFFTFTPYYYETYLLNYHPAYVPGTTEADPTVRTNHSVKFTINPALTYYYRIESHDANGKVVTSPAVLGVIEGGVVPPRNIRLIDRRVSVHDLRRISPEDMRIPLRIVG